MESKGGYGYGGPCTARGERCTVRGRDCTRRAANNVLLGAGTVRSPNGPNHAQRGANRGAMEKTGDAAIHRLTYDLTAVASEVRGPADKSLSRSRPSSCDDEGPPALSKACVAYEGQHEAPRALSAIRGDRLRANESVNPADTP